MSKVFTPEMVKAECLRVEGFSDDQLVHYFKIISSKSTKKEKTLFAPLQKSIEKERKKRGTKTISSSIVKPKITKQDLGAKPDDY